MVSNFLKGKIIKIFDNKRLIINLGIKQGVKKDMKFFIYDSDYRC